MTGFTAKYIDEPDLMFSEGEAKDPRVGLVEYGPRTPSGEPEHQVINVGLIGSSWSIAGMDNLFKDMQTVITADEEEAKRWKPPFPGAGERSPLKFSISTQKRWRMTLTSEEIRSIKKFRSQERRMEEALDVIELDMQVLYDKETPPDVIAIAIPEELMDSLTPSHQDHARIQSGESDFHNRIKLMGMDLGIPTQLVEPATLRGEKQGRSEVAWNLAVGMLYKAQRGHPWKLTHLEEGTCYAGISFYRQRGGDQSQTRASMAQVFLETGESFILRGDPLEEQTEGRGANHLSATDAEKLVEKILTHYERHKGMSPERLVLHKTSNFWEEETDGFLAGASGIRRKDFVTIRENHDIRVLSSGIYPVLRGTVVTPPGQEEHYLYTKGFVPALETYPGPNIPEPLIVQPDKEISDSPYQDICEEILAFTKLDWNTSDFSKKNPVTIRVSDAVSNILAEASARDMTIDSHYYFYM